MDPSILIAAAAAAAGATTALVAGVLGARSARRTRMGSSHQVTIKVGDVAIDATLDFSDPKSVDAFVAKIESARRLAAEVRTYERPTDKRGGAPSSPTPLPVHVSAR